MREGTGSGGQIEKMVGERVIALVEDTAGLLSTGLS